MAIITLQDLPRSPINYSSEYFDKYLSLVGKITPLTTTGDASWTSPSSGITYSATTGGEAQLLSLLEIALNNYLLDADKWNSIQTEINGSTLDLKTDMLETRALMEKYVNANIFANKTGYGGYTLFDSLLDDAINFGTTTASINTTAKTCTWDSTNTKLLAFNPVTFNNNFSSIMCKIDGSYKTGVVQSNVTNSNSVVIASPSYTLTTADKLYAYSVASSKKKEIGISSVSGVSTTYDKTTPVTAATGDFTTQRNGGRKLVRLSNGWIVYGVWDSANNQVKIFVSKDNFATTPTQLCNYFMTGLTDFSMVAVGNMVYILITNATSAQYGKFDATTVTNTTQSMWMVDNSQTATSDCSITLGTDGNLHAAWDSKNASYPNSFNLKYAKGTINGDGSVTWGTVEQLSTENITGNYVQSSCIVSALVNGKPIIFSERKSGTDYRIFAWRWTGSTWAISGTPTSTYTQKNPSATVDSNGDCHVTWDGQDSTDTTAYNIRYSKVTGGGVTWSTPVKLTTGNTYAQVQPSIACDSNNDLHVAWYGLTATSPIYSNIRMIKSTSGTWGDITEVTAQNAVNIQNPSLCDNYRNFEKPLMIYKEGTTAIKFYGKWTDGGDYTLTLSENVTQLANDSLPITTQYTVKQGSTVFNFDSSINGLSLQYKLTGLSTPTVDLSILGKSTTSTAVAYAVG